MLTKQNLAIFQHSFVVNRFVVVSDFIEAAIAEKTHAFLTRDMPENWWVAAIRLPSADPVFFKSVAVNRATIRDLAAAAGEGFAHGRFSYFHFRTLDDHPENCRCQICVVRTLLRSEQMADALHSITGLRLEEPREIFASRYDAGCFLGTHTDAAQGRVAFVWNLTKGWRPQFGGSLHLLDSRSLQTKQVISPGFNTLAVFAVGDGTDTPHFVSHVVPGVRGQRLAFSGWYD